MSFGEWTTTAGRDWTGGHFAGQLWLAASRYGRYRKAAGEYSPRPQGRENWPTIVRDFFFHYGAALGPSRSAQ